MELSAVVTGASDGIGKAFAFQLAAKGFNIILISRNRQKSLAVGQQIERKHNVETLVLACDFAEDEERYARIKERLSDYNIGILVNNVGMSLKYPEYFHQMPNGDKFIQEIIRCNILATTMMTKICLPQMEKRGCGAVINIASVSALLPSPLVALYSATKAYVDFFSRCLQLEYAGKGIVVQTILPFTVATNMTGNPAKGFFVPSPERFARSCLSTLGILNRTHGCFSHSIQGWYYSLLPEWISARLQWNFFFQLRTTILEQMKTESKRGKIT